MKNILRHSPLLLHLSLAILMSQGCYSPRNMQATRLQQIQAYPGITYIAIADTEPLNRIWILSDLQVTDKDLTANFELAPEDFGYYIDRIDSNQEYRANQDFVYIYIQPVFAQQITDRSRQTIGFHQIRKTIVYEPDQAETNGVICLGLAGAGGILTVFYWLIWAF